MYQLASCVYAMQAPSQHSQFLFFQSVKNIYVASIKMFSIPSLVIQSSRTSAFGLHQYYI